MTDKDRTYSDLFELGLKFRSMLIDDYFDSYKNDMTYLQCRVFDSICAESGTNAKRLSDAFGLSKQHVSLIVEKLLSDGLICRQKDPADLRSMLLMPTPDGLIYYKEHLDRSFKRYTNMIRLLSDEELSKFSEDVSSLRKLMEKMESGI